MNFNIGFYPIYGVLLGFNWSKIELHQIQIPLFIFILEIEWENYLND
jgi:hypothetical protein